MKIPPEAVHEAPVPEQVDVAKTGGFALNILWADGYPYVMNAVRIEPGGQQRACAPPEALKVLADIISDQLGGQIPASAKPPAILLARGPLGHS